MLDPANRKVVGWAMRNHIRAVRVSDDAAGFRIGCAIWGPEERAIGLQNMLVDRAARLQSDEAGFTAAAEPVMLRPKDAITAPRRAAGLHRHGPRRER